jgi:hypothetical protein
VLEPPVLGVNLIDVTRGSLHAAITDVDLGQAEEA